MARKSGIYQIRNTRNGKCYIGSASYFNSRWARHRRDLRSNLHSNIKLQSGWNKYGEEIFEFTIVEECDRTILLEREQYWIDTLQPAYNILSRAHSSLGLKHSDETKEKLRQIFKGRPPSNKGIPRSEETKQRLKEAWVRRKARGDTVSDETREKLRNVHLGKPKSQSYIEKRRGFKMSEEAKAKISIANTGKTRTDSSKQKMVEAQKRIIKSRNRDSSGRLLKTE